MSIINKYLIKEIFSSLFGVASVLLLILVSGQLVTLYDQVLSGSMPVNTILFILGLNLLSNLTIILPLSYYLAILLAFGRLYRDHEMVVLAACGIGQFRLLAPLMRITLIFAVMMGILSLYLAPWALDKSRQLIQAAEAKTDVQAMGTGKFRETPGGKGVIYIEEAKPDSNKLQNIFIQQGNGDSSSIISASSGHQTTDDKTGIRFLVLENGYRYDGQPGEGDYVVTRFKRHGIRLTDQTLLSSKRRHKERTMKELWKSWNRYAVAEIQNRISVILLSIILAILALPLSKTSARQGRYSKLGLALLIYIIYTNLLNASGVWIERGKIPYYVGVWWVHLAMLLAVVSFYIHPRTITKLWSRRKPASG